jgi:poly(3-hydroxybutyrate) depolymerase
MFRIRVFRHPVPPNFDNSGVSVFVPAFSRQADKADPGGRPSGEAGLSRLEPTIREWAASIGCPTDARVTAELTGQAGSREAGHTAPRYVWAPCREGAEVVLWKFMGTGHVWPGGLQDYLPRLLGPSTPLVDANLEMWRFFQRFAL